MNKVYTQVGYDSYPAYAYEEGGSVISCEWQINVNQPAAYYWACQAEIQTKYKRTSTIVYFGLQTSDNPKDGRYVNFSLFADNSTRKETTSSHCSRFTHEGTGTQCRRNYEWENGVVYKFVCYVEGDMFSGWVASPYAEEKEKREWFFLGDIINPKHEEDKYKFTSMVAFYEDYELNAIGEYNCGDRVPGTSILKNLEIDYYKLSLSSTTQHSACDKPHVYYTSCNKHFCISTVMNTKIKSLIEIIPDPNSDFHTQVKDKENKIDDDSYDFESESRRLETTTKLTSEPVTSTTLENETNQNVTSESTIRQEENTDS